MCKSELFNLTLNAVSQEMEIAAKRILSHDMDSEVVDARHLLIRILTARGLYSSEVARLIGCTRRTVTHVLTHFDERLARSWIMRRAWEKIGKPSGN
jgi:hypothetical protein